MTVIKTFQLINVLRIDTGKSLKVGFLTVNERGTRKVFYCDPLLEEKAMEELYQKAPTGERTIDLDFRTEHAQQVIGWKLH